MTTEIIRPNANGDLQGAPYQSPASGEHWDKVDEVVADDYGTWVYGHWSINYKELYHLSSPPPFASISSVTVYCRGRGTNPYNYGNFGYVLIKTHGVVYQGYGDWFYNSQGWKTISSVWNTNPFTGAAWTNDELAALQAGFYAISGASFGNGVYLTQVYVSITGNLPVLPTVTTDPATLISSSAATLNGTLDNDGGEPCQCGFEWGKTIVYDNTTPIQSRTTGQTFAQTITGLDPNKTYHFRAFATNAAGTSYGADRTFTTLVALPAVTTDPATELGTIAATLNGTLDDDGGELCDCGFEWGLTESYGKITPAQGKTSGEYFSQVLTELEPDTVYHFRSLASNVYGLSYGVDRAFKPLSLKPPPYFQGPLMSLLEEDTGNAD